MNVLKEEQTGETDITDVGAALDVQVDEAAAAAVGGQRAQDLRVATVLHAKVLEFAEAAKATDQLVEVALEQEPLAAAAAATRGLANDEHGQLFKDAKVFHDSAANRLGDASKVQVTQLWKQRHLCGGQRSEHIRTMYSFLFVVKLQRRSYVRPWQLLLLLF